MCVSASFLIQQICKAANMMKQTTSSFDAIFLTADTQLADNWLGYCSSPNRCCQVPVGFGCD